MTATATCYTSTESARRALFNELSHAYVHPTPRLRDVAKNRGKAKISPRLSGRHFKTGTDIKNRPR